MFDIGIDRTLGIDEQEAGQLARWLDERTEQTKETAFYQLGKKIDFAAQGDTYGSADPVVLAEHEREMMLSVLQEHSDEIPENSKLDLFAKRLKADQIVRAGRSPEENAD